MVKDSITTSSWTDGVNKLKNVMNTEEQKDYIEIYSSGKLDSSLYKSNPDIEISIISFGDKFPKQLTSIRHMFKSMLTKWYDLHDNEDSDNDCNENPFIQCLDKSSLHPLIFKNLLPHYTKDVKYPVYKKGLWYI